MNGKCAEINNISKHVVLCSSRLSVLSYFFFFCCSIASPLSAWHCMPALRALRSPAILDRLGRALASKKTPKNVLGASSTVSAPSWSVLALSWAVLAPTWSVLGAILGRLGAILAHLGAILGRFGRILESQKPATVAARRLLRLRCAKPVKLCKS